jgi:hypothetical protein
MLHPFNEDQATAIASLDRLAGVDAGFLLPGHGEPWSQGTQAAIEAARRRA